MNYIDFLIINEIEAQKSTEVATRINGKISISGIHNAASKLLDMGIKKAVVIHFPEGGFLLDNRHENIFVESDYLEPDDIMGTVGAGDAFCAGFLYAVHENIDYKKSLKIANQSAWFNLHDETSTGGAVPFEKILEKID